MQFNKLSPRETEIILMLFDCLKSKNSINDILDAGVISSTELSVILGAGREFLLANPELQQKINFELQHHCNQKFETEYDLIIGSRYLGRQEVPRQKEDYETRECYRCGSSFAGRKLRKLNSVVN